MHIESELQLGAFLPVIYHVADQIFTLPPLLTGGTLAAATAQRVGMQWVGETDKYYGLPLHVYRLRPPDLVTENAAAEALS